MSEAVSSSQLFEGPEAPPTSRSGEAQLRAFFGHHKCATGWIDQILREVCFHIGLHFDIVALPVDYQRYGSLEAYVRHEQVDFLSYINADEKQAAGLPLYRGIHVVRDPRDVLVSAYFSHRNSHPTDHWPELEPHRDRLRSLSKEEGLFAEMEFSRPEFDEMHRWNYDQAHILELQMETLTKHPVDGFHRIIRFLDLMDTRSRSTVGRAAHWLQLKLNRLNRKGRRFMPGDLPMFPVPRRRLRGIPPSQLDVILEKKSFSNLSGGRSKGQENTKDHYRKGTPGDWKNHFNDEHIRYFKDQYNDVLVKLGYESDGSW